MKPTEPQTTFMDPVAPSQGQCQARAALQPLISLFAPFSRRGISGADDLPLC